jgi:hypothetical protein
MKELDNRDYKGLSHSNGSWVDDWEEEMSMVIQKEPTEQVQAALNPWMGQGTRGAGELAPNCSGCPWVSSTRGRERRKSKRNRRRRKRRSRRRKWRRRRKRRRRRRECKNTNLFHLAST